MPHVRSVKSSFIFFKRRGIRYLYDDERVAVLVAKRSLKLIANDRLVQI